MNSGQLKAEAIKVVRTRLVADGWTDLTGRGHILIRRASTDVLERIGLSLGLNRKDRTISIDPFVGVRYEPVAALVESFYKDSQATAVAASTVVTGLADVCAGQDRSAWVFAGTDDLGNAAEAVAGALLNAGYDFMHEFHDLDRIKQELEQKPMSREYSDSLAVIYALEGDLGSARTVLAARLAEANDLSAPELAAQSRGFVERLQEHFSFRLL